MKSKGTVLWIVRLLLLSRIVIVLLALGFALVLWQRNSQTLLRSVEELSVANPSLAMLERGITTLYQAENNFRFYSATYDRSYFKAYTHDLNSVSAIIDSLQILPSVNSDVSKIEESLTQKADISKVVIRLKMLTDSLLTVTGQWDTSAAFITQVPKFDIRKIQNLQKTTSIDSIIDTATNQKKGFLRKVKNLFKDEEATNRGIIVKRSELTNDTVVESRVEGTPEYALLQDIHSFYSNKINSYSDGRNRLNANEKALAAVNTMLIEEIVRILKEIKLSELEKTRLIQDKALQSGERSARTISVIAAISVLIAAVFFFMVLHYLGKIKESTAKLEYEKHKAETLASQKTMFISGMSHEIRAPLNNILGFAEQLKNSPDENREKYLAAINTSAELMLSTVNQILDFSKLESGKMVFNKENFSPFNAIENAAGTMILRARDKKLMLNLHLPAEEDVKVNGDKFKLEQIIVNIIDNAIKYTDKGEIKVSASVKPSADGYRAFIEVADTGIGIPSDKVTDIFNEFERLEDNGDRRWKPGTGLGLPIAKMVIEQQGGKIYVKETSDKGTIFAIELPYNKPTHEMVKNAEPIKPAIIPPGKTILLADDDAFSILLITTICNKHNIKVITAENGQVAFAKASENGFDLILTDINMPVLSGIDFTRKIRNTPAVSSIPIIAVTANVMNEDLRRLNDAGFSEVLYKPFRESEFIEKIRVFLQ